jgi:hypothetical protein
MRLLVIKEETDSNVLSARLLRASLSAAQSEAALERLQELNPHVDLAKLQPGTMLFVPDAPAFKVSETEGVLNGVLEAFERLVKGGLDDAAAKSRAGVEERLAESAEVAKTLKSAAFKRLFQDDPALEAEAKAATAEIKKEKEEAEAAQQALADAAKEALAALRSIMSG